MWLDNRFWEKVNKNGQIPEHNPELGHCWEWTASTDKKGYGLFRLNERIKRAHILSYRFAKGEIPEGYTLDHLCLRTWCVNPNHLEAITRKENNQRQAKTADIPHEKIRKEWNPKPKIVFRKLGQNAKLNDDD